MKLFTTVVAMGEQERIGLEYDNIRLTFSNLTMLLGRKSLNIIDLLQIEFMPICHLKVILLISECTFMILAKFAHKLRRPFVILPL